jgi:hypothetical protein
MGSLSDSSTPGVSILGFIVCRSGPAAEGQLQTLHSYAILMVIAAITMFPRIDCAGT